MAAHGMNDDEKQATHKTFRQLVNMSAKHLRAWLDSDESQSVGMTANGEKVTAPNNKESVGHHMGERILEIQGKKPADLSDRDFADMRKVVGYIRRHSAQRPEGDISNTRWRAALRNWGHDPQ